MSSYSNVRGDDKGDITLEAMLSVGQKEQAELNAEQLESKAAFQANQEELVNPFGPKMGAKDKKIDTKKTRIKEMLKTKSTAPQLLPVQKIKESSEKFQGHNQELRANILALLRERIKPGDTKEDILRKLAEFYPDATLADEVLDFLIETTEGELAEVVAEAKVEFTHLHEREIIAGRNIGDQAKAASERGLGTQTSMRDMYREITGNPRDSTTLFQELSNKYAFKDLKKVIDFLLHSLGADFKSKGPSIPRGLLHRLLTETRSLQAILGVYRFFRGRMHLVETLFHKENLELSSQVSFENIAKLFMELCAERHPSGSKALQLPGKLGLENWVFAKIIVLSQMRDAVREVALNQIYKSIQHRDDLYLAILEALEDLEDQVDDLANQQGVEEKEKEKGKMKK